jgi:hypothetical protein
MEGLQYGSAHLVLQFDEQVKTCEMSCLAGITERCSAVFDISRTKSFRMIAAELTEQKKL